MRGDWCALLRCAFQRPLAATRSNNLSLPLFFVTVNITSGLTSNNTLHFGVHRGVRGAVGGMAAVLEQPFYRYKGTSCMAGAKSAWLCLRVPRRVFFVSTSARIVTRGKQLKRRVKIGHATSITLLTSIQSLGRAIPGMRGPGRIVMDFCAPAEWLIHWLVVVLGRGGREAGAG